MPNYSVGEKMHIALPQRSPGPNSDASEKGSGNRNLLKLTVSLVLLQVYLGFFLIVNWGNGIERGGIVAGLLVGLMLLRFRPKARGARAKIAADSKHAPRPLRILLTIALIFDLGIAGYTLTRSVQS